MDPARLAFDIQVSIQSANTSVTQILHLNPTQPFLVNDVGTVTAKLLGDLATYQSMPDFSSNYLMIPSPVGLFLASFPMIACALVIFDFGTAGNLL